MSENKDPVVCRVAPDWHDAGKIGDYYGKHLIADRWWAVVIWDLEDDPDIVKLESLELMSKQWLPAKPD